MLSILPMMGRRNYRILETTLFVLILMLLLLIATPVL
jgi:hypothetical protein